MVQKNAGKQLPFFGFCGRVSHRQLGILATSIATDDPLFVYVFSKHLQEEIQDCLAGLAKIHSNNMSICNNTPWLYSHGKSPR
jgi:hypothetical protein